MTNLDFLIPVLGDDGGPGGWGPEVTKALTNVDALAETLVRPTNPDDITAALLSAIDRSDGRPVIVPPGRWLVDPTVVEKYLHVISFFPATTHLVPRLSITEPLISFAPTAYAVGNPNLGYYGRGIQNIGLDLTNSPNGHGVDFPGHPYGGHPIVNGFWCLGGDRQIHMAQANGEIERCKLSDGKNPIVVDGDKGTELHIDKVRIFRNIAGTTEIAILVESTTTDPDDRAKGAVWLRDVRLSVARQAGVVEATRGFRAVAALENLELPIFMSNCTWDNVDNALSFVNIAQVKVGGDWWANCGNLGPCVEITGGHNLHFRDALAMNGGPLGNPRTFEFRGEVGYFSSRGSRIHTAPAYYFADGASGTPLSWDVDDFVSGDGPLSNDMTKLRAAHRKRRLHGLEIDDPLYIKSNGPTGIVTLGAGGTARVTHSGVLAANSRFAVGRWLADGDLGTEYNVTNIVDGEYFDLASNDPGDRSVVQWLHWLET